MVEEANLGWNWSQVYGCPIYFTLLDWAGCVLCLIKRKRALVAEHNAVGVFVRHIAALHYNRVEGINQVDAK